MNQRCAHCGADVSASFRRAIAHCASCRGTSVLWRGGSAALSIAKVGARVADEQAKRALTDRVALEGFGVPEILETKLLRIPFLAREGRMLTIIRNDGVRTERVDDGLFGVALGLDAALPVEMLDPRVLQPAAEADTTLPELSLDTFDLCVREKLEAKIFEAEKPTHVDLHPTWGPRVHLVHFPFVSMTFALKPNFRWLRAIEKHPTGRYEALVSLHDGVVKWVELPKIRDRTEVGWLAGIGLLGVALCVLAALLFLVVLAVYFA